VTRRALPAALALVLAAGGCAAARLPPLTDGDVVMDRDEQRLWRVAEEAVEDARHSGALDPDAALEKYVTGVARKLVPPKALARLRLHVFVVADPRLDAFALADGSIFVSTGLLSRLENEAQLAVLLGHELTHALQRHIVVEHRTAKNSAAVSASFGGGLGLGRLGAAATVAGYSRDLEREADELGLELAVRAGYDAHEAARPFEHLLAWMDEEELDEPFLFADHPRLKDRIATYRRLLATTYAEKKSGDKGQERYVAAVREAYLRTARLDLAAGRFGAAERGAQRYLELRPRSGAALALLGDATRQKGGDGAEGRAADHYRKALAADPACAEAQRGLGLVLVQGGDRKGARAALRRYLELRPRAEDRAWIEADLSALEGKP
jgi:beta-barrel assembly-enhancing protease